MIFEAACTGRAKNMFGLKLPSQLKKGAAEEEHSIKKARGELVVPLDPEAGLVWKKNKGGPVWGVKGQTDAPPEPKKEVSIKLKPAWSTQPPTAVHSIAGDLAKPKAYAQNPPSIRTSAWAVPQPPETKKMEREPVFQGNAWADEVEAEEILQIESSKILATVEETPAPQKPAVREGGRYSGFIREEADDRAARETREEETTLQPESEREADRDVGAERMWRESADSSFASDSRISDRPLQPSNHSSDRWAEKSTGERGSERAIPSGQINRGLESPRGGGEGGPLPRDREGARSFAQTSYDRGQGYQSRERWEDAQRGGRPANYGHGYAYAARGYDGSSPRDNRPNWRGEGGSGDKYSGSNFVRSTDRYEEPQGTQRYGYGAGTRESESLGRSHGSESVMGRSGPAPYRPPASFQQKQANSRPAFSDMDPTNPNPIEARGLESSLDADRRPRSTSLTEDPRS